MVCFAGPGETFGRTFVAVQGGMLTALLDADHFKVALGQVSTAKHLIETISRDYVRLLKVDNVPELHNPQEQ